MIQKVAGVWVHVEGLGRFRALFINLISYIFPDGSSNYELVLHTYPDVFALVMLAPPRARGSIVGKKNLPAKLLPCLVGFVRSSWLRAVPSSFAALVSR